VNASTIRSFFVDSAEPRPYHPNRERFLHSVGVLRMHSVLIVDDDPQMRDILASSVDAAGFDVRTASSAEEALAVMGRRTADILLSDVHMPGQNGVWLASRIREQYPSTAIIMATSGREADIAVASLKNDVVDYLLKPFDGARLREALALARDWHRDCAGAENLHVALQDRLRTRRTTVAGAVAQAQASPREAIDGLIAMLQLQDRDGRGHATRVARLAMAIADELDLDDDAAADLEHGALLHDIGKLDMPAAILSKPAPLTAAEWDVMRTHPQVGYDLVSRLPGLSGAAEIVLSHHEAFDGSGYPRGLKGDEIPLAARILTVADSYDSMTHPHTQRPAMAPTLAIREIERCQGSQFDPVIAAALGAVMTHAAEEKIPA
jgi:putative nucleotidyltransferase with HDIG domain